MLKNKNHFLGAITLILIIAGLVALYSANKEVQERIIEREIKGLEAGSNNTSKNLHYFFNKYLGELSFLTELKDIQKLNATGKNLMRVFYEHNQDNIKAITRVTKDGHIEYTIPYVKSAIGKDVSMQKHNKEIMREHLPLISDVFKAVQGYRTIAFAYPIFDENGNYDGALTLLLPFETIAQAYIDSLRASNEITTLLLSAKGIILYSSKKEDVHKSIFNSTVNKPLPDSVIKEILCDDNGALRYSAKDSTQKKIGYISIYSQVPLVKSHWVILLTIPIKSVLGNLHTYNLQFVFIISTLSLGLFLFAFVFYRSRSKAYKKIEEQKELFRMAADMTGQIIYEHEIPTGKIIWAGAIEKVTGYPIKKFTTYDFNDWLKICHPEEKNLHKFDQETIKKLHNPLTREYRIRRQDGEFITVEDNSYFVMNSNSEAVKQIGTIKDISERKKAEAELRKYQEKLEEIVKARTRALRETNRLLSDEIEKRKLNEIELIKALKQVETTDKLKYQFLQMISHEFRTPLGIIINNVDLLFDNISNPDDEELLSSKYSIISASNRITRTVDSIVIMSELQNDSYEQRLEKFNLFEDAVDSVCENLKYDANNRKNNFTWENDAGKILILQDRFAIELILKHVIENALEYTKNGYVEVRVSKNEKGAFIVTVQDTGEGISEEYLPQIFTVFSQEKGGYRRKHEGSGLGLALVKKLCDKSGIEINVKSKKGQGTLVTLIITSLQNNSSKEH